MQNCEEKYNLQKLFSKRARRCPAKYILYKIKPNRIGQKSHFSLKSFYFWVEVFCQCISVSTCTTCLPWISNLLQIRSNNFNLFLGLKAAIKKYQLLEWYQASCCKVAFCQRDFQQCVIKRSSLERRYYVLAELTELLYVNTENLIKIQTISIRVVSLHFVSFCYKSILVRVPLISYVNIYSFN